MTPEIKRDLQLLKSRSVLDPKRFYKRDSSKGLHKFFQESFASFYDYAGKLI